MRNNYICPYCKQLVDSELTFVQRGRGRYREIQYFHKECYLKNTRGSINAVRNRNNAS